MSRSRNDEIEDIVRELRDNLEGAIEEAADLWYAARDASAKEPDFTREGNRFAADNAAFLLTQSLMECVRQMRRVDNLKEFPNVPDLTSSPEESEAAE